MRGTFLPISCRIYLNSQSGVCILASCWEPDSIVYVWLWHLLLRSDSSSRNECQQCQKGGSLFNLVASAVAAKSYNINAHVCVLAFMWRPLIAHQNRSCGCRKQKKWLLTDSFFKWWGMRNSLCAARKGLLEFKWGWIGLKLIKNSVWDGMDGTF